MTVRNVCESSQCLGGLWCPEDGGRIYLRNFGILQHYTTSQPRRPREDGGSTDLRNFGIQPQHYTTSQPRRPREDGGSMDLRNVGTYHNTTRLHNPEDLVKMDAAWTCETLVSLSKHYTVLQHRRPQNFNFWTYESIWTFGRTPCMGDQPDARPLPTQDRTTQKNTDTH